MAATDTTSAPAELKPYVETDRMEVLRVGILGAIAGLVTPLLALAIANWFIVPVFCQGGSNTFGVCSSGGVVAYHTAAIIVGVAAVALFANWGVFRPLPLVLAVTISMWGFKKFVEPLSAQAWIEYFLFSIILTTLCYMLFYWLLRIRNFPASILITGAATALICWALVA